jgi:hypothetical protein
VAAVAAAAAAKKPGGSSEFEHANAAAAVPDTNPLRKHQSQKLVRKQVGGKKGASGSKQGGSG